MATPARAVKVNRSGFPKKAYDGLPTTLCQGCGHNSITGHIITAYYELGISPYKIAKMSGIGCSSKAITYFIDSGHGFNGLHGRMASVAAGASVANRELNVIGVSGDGDTVNIGTGQFVHTVRRNVRMVYIIENNGVYGLTKGQFSATADVGVTLRTGEVNQLKPIDCCGLAIELGCDFVARAYSGDPKHVVPLLKAAITHRGLALLDIISPCVTYNNHEGSTKSYKYVKEHKWALDAIDFIPSYESREVEHAEGETLEVKLPDGSYIVLKKLEKEYDPTDRISALRVLHEAKAKKQILTGLLYINPDTAGLDETLGLVDKPLAQLSQEELCLPKEALEEIMESFR
jgi:2-oxoglutarate ferredoxin oxidoreductase subunit beta